MKSSIGWILPGVNTGLNGWGKRGRLYFLPASYRLHSVLLTLCRSDGCVLDFSLVCHSFDDWRIDRCLNTGGGAVRNWLPTRPLGCAWEFLRQLTTKIWAPALPLTIKGRRIKEKAGAAQTMGLNWLNGSAGKVFCLLRHLLICDIDQQDDRAPRLVYKHGECPLRAFFSSRLFGDLQTRTRSPKMTRQLPTT